METGRRVSLLALARTQDTGELLVRRLSDSGLYVAVLYSGQPGDIYGLRSTVVDLGVHPETAEAAAEQFQDVWEGGHSFLALHTPDELVALGHGMSFSS